MSKRIPDFFIVGAPKCGTSSLFQYLQSHPNIFLPSAEKEPHFFSQDLGGFTLSRYRNMEDYLSLFDDAPRDQAVGEASVYYLYSQTAVSNIVMANPNAKFIVMIRNPTDMVYSLHNEFVTSFVEDVKDFEQAWHLQKVRSSGNALPRDCGEPKLLQYREVCALGTQLERLFLKVPWNQVLVVVLDDLKSSPREVYKRALSFLGLEDDGRIDFNVVNRSKVVRNEALGVALHRARASLGSTYLPLKRCLNGFRLRPFQWLNAVNTNPRSRRSLRPGFRAYLDDVFAAEVRTLEGLLGRSFIQWQTHVQCDAGVVT